MTKYVFTKTNKDIKETIKLTVEDMCKKNRINYNKQNYMISFSEEQVLFKNNGTPFTSGSKKTLSFYGKIYSDKNKKIIECIHVDEKRDYVEIDGDGILVICGGIQNSTFIKHYEEITHFYVAPSGMLEWQNPENWETL
jgi:hypothetical protein